MVWDGAVVVAVAFAGILFAVHLRVSFDPWGRLVRLYSDNASQAIYAFMLN